MSNNTIQWVSIRSQWPGFSCTRGFVPIWSCIRLDEVPGLKCLSYHLWRSSQITSSACFAHFVRTGKECKEKFPHFTQQSGYIDVQRSQQQGVSFWNHFSMGQLIGTSIFFRKKASCEATIWLALIFHILQNQSVNDMMFNRNAITLATSYSKLSNITSCDPYLGVCTNGGSPKWMVYNGKSIYKWMIWYPDFRKPPFIYVLICLIKFVG